jgi:hypothetical protein
VSKVLRERQKPYKKILHGRLFFRAPWVHLFAGRFAHLHAPEEMPSRHHTQINRNAKAFTILLLCRYQTEGRDFAHFLEKSVMGYVKTPLPDLAIRPLFHTNRTGAKSAPQRRRIGMVALYEKQRRRFLA